MLCATVAPAPARAHLRHGRQYNPMRSAIQVSTLLVKQGDSFGVVQLVYNGDGKGGKLK